MPIPWDIVLQKSVKIYFFGVMVSNRVGVLKYQKLFGEMVKRFENRFTLKICKMVRFWFFYEF